MSINTLHFSSHWPSVEPGCIYLQAICFQASRCRRMPPAHAAWTLNICLLLKQSRSVAGREVHACGILKPTCSVAEADFVRCQVQLAEVLPASGTSRLVKITMNQAQFMLLVVWQSAAWQPWTLQSSHNQVCSAQRAMCCRRCQSHEARIVDSQACLFLLAHHITRLHNHPQSRW